MHPLDDDKARAAVGTVAARTTCTVGARVGRAATTAAAASTTTSPKGSGAGR